jgi:iron(III) transport system substrate-binding protein
MASIIANEGAENAQAWAEGVVSNFARKPQGNDTTQIKSVALGECEISVVNSYYLARYAGSSDSELRAIFDAIGVVFPDQGGKGTHINISGAGLLKYAPNKDNAQTFIEYLTDNSAQEYFVNGNNEYPVVETVSATSAVQQMGDFEESTLNVAELGINQNEAVKVFDRAGWQ